MPSAVHASTGGTVGRHRLARAPLGMLATSNGGRGLSGVSLQSRIAMHYKNTLRTLAVFSLLACATIGAAQAQSQIMSGAGTASGGNFGFAVASVGDIDNDGYDDVAVGSPLDDTKGLNAGKVNIISGKTGAILITKYGDAPGQQLGFSVSGLNGDASGDGLADFMAGAPYASTAGASAGMVRVYSGTGATMATINGAAAGDRFGYSCAFAGFTGSTRIIIGAPYRNHAQSDAGSAYLYFYGGSYITELQGSQASEHFGWSVGGGYSIYSDANPEVVVGRPDYIYNGGQVGMVSIYQAVSPYTNWASIPGPFGIGARYGTSVAVLKDVNGDGAADVLIGAPEYSSARGAAEVRAGATGASLYQIIGTSAGDHCGWSVASCGDVNADGKTEFAVGSPDAVPFAGVTGKVVIYNSTGSVYKTFNGAFSDERFGYSVSGGGDFNNDNKPDVVMGAPYMYDWGTDAGVARLYSLTTGSIIQSVPGPTSGDAYGSAVRIVGDVNGDGFADFAVGAPFADHKYYISVVLVTVNNAGSVQIRSGKDNTLLYTVWGTAEGDNLGTSVAACGDLNGDGISDFIAGAPQSGATSASPGYARVYSGANGSIIYTLASVINNEAFGYSVDGASDLNNDGWNDLLIGAPKSSQYGLNAGYATAYSGKTGFYLWIAHDSIVGDQYGFSVAGLGADVNGDGRDDVAVGAPFHYSNGGSGGRVDVLSGANGNVIYTINGGGGGDEFGYSVAAAGDINLDGKTDVLAGAPYKSTLAALNGAVYAISGANGSILQTFTGPVLYDILGLSVASVGDIDNDGRPDYAAGGSQQYFGSILGNGVVEVISAASNVQLYRIAGNNSGDGSGIAIGGLGDVNNNGTNDIIIGGPTSKSGGTGSGVFQVYDLKPAGVSYYGIGTPGCHGAQTLKTQGAAQINNINFGFHCDKTPANALGVLLITDSQDLAGGDPFGLGILLHVDFFQALEVYSFDTFSDAAGYGGAVTPIPNNPAIAGNTYYGQTLWLETDCLLQPNNVYNLSASAAVKFVIIN
ncbi:MAG: FG-GAP repeat protein [Planctomycetes bacterium]|nr:FG-GAP repeat protein [Planctomycetota bacterium]